MKPSRLTIMGLLALALMAPALAQTPPQPPLAPSASGTVTGHGDHARMWNMVEGLNGITDTQRQQIEALRTQYEQNNQPGTTPSHGTMRALRQQLMQILTPAQQTQLRSQLQQFRRQHQAQQPPNASPPPRP